MTRELAHVKGELRDCMARLEEKKVALQTMQELLAQWRSGGMKNNGVLQEVQEVLDDALRREKTGFEGGSAIRVHYHTHACPGSRLLVIYGDTVEIVSDEHGTEERVDLSSARWDLKPIDHYALVVNGFPEPWILKNLSSGVDYKFSSRRGERHHIVSRFRCALGLEPPQPFGFETKTK